MHVHSFQHVHDLHIFERSRMAIEHHAIATLILTIIIILGVGHALSLQSSRVGVFQFSGAPEAGIRLSRFADPQYAHETAARERAMRAALRGLRSDLQTVRTYVVVYSDLAATNAIWKEQQIIRIFEVTKTGVAPTLQHWEGLSRLHWLQAEDYTRGASWLFEDQLPKTYGMELYDE
ncbi:hypothetical protein U27_02883 [Candidatus Vecturithrix granuli]|uniref:Uncharacterized protein n=1 Tax=Vecturithrix granuli TaxID=1499967 RepID=A0A081BUB7_VECG1|nr:hypothetical protein U27_02883 [Candidatus Vecturithrix granuli]